MTGNVKRMRKTVPLVCAALAVSAPPLKADTRFIPGFDAVPLLEGFRESEDSRVVFDAPSGTIAEITLISSKGDVLQTYKTALEGLGWSCRVPQTPMMCRREGQVLRLSFSDQTRHLKLALAPERAR